jgi:predicted transcriptional regulator
MCCRIREGFYPRSTRKYAWTKTFRMASAIAGVLCVMRPKILILLMNLWFTMSTTIQIQPETKSRLDALKAHPQESDDETLNRIMDVLFDPEPLSEETLQRIEEGLADMRAGRCRSLEEIAQELGLE